MSVGTAGEFEVIPTLQDYWHHSSDSSADRCTLTAVGDRTDDRARTAHWLNGSGGLTTVADNAFVVYVNVVSVRQPNLFNDAGKTYVVPLRIWMVSKLSDSVALPETTPMYHR